MDKVVAEVNGALYGPFISHNTLDAYMNHIGVTDFKVRTLNDLFELNSDRA